MISLDCNEGVCPLVDAIVTCQFTNGENGVRWSGSAIGGTMTVSNGVPVREQNGFVAAFFNDSKLSTLTFNATADRNTTVVGCQDLTVVDILDCTITIAGYATHTFTVLIL